jgi:hypothetical protein
MRDSIRISCATFTRLLAAAGLALILAGCVSPHEKPPLERGWIGGDYRQAKAMNNSRPAGIEAVALRTNTPAALAGLQTGDVILELDRQPVTKLKGFWRQIDSSKPGTSFPVKVYRAGGTVECQLTVGRETFRNTAYGGIALPTAVHEWNLWSPVHGFSVVFAGFNPNVNDRREMAKQNVDSQVYDKEWCAWAAFLFFSKGKTVLSQECAGPEIAMRVPGMALR